MAWPVMADTEGKGPTRKWQENRQTNAGEPEAQETRERPRMILNNRSHEHNTIIGKQ